MRPYKAIQLKPDVYARIRAISEADRRPITTVIELALSQYEDWRNSQLYSAVFTPAPGDRDERNTSA